MKFRFDFSVDAWVRALEIEADSLDEAKEELLKMSIEDLIDEGYVEDFEIDNLDVEYDEEDEDIEDLDDEDFDDLIESLEDDEDLLEDSDQKSVFISC